MYDKNISKSPVKRYKGEDRGWSCVIDSGDKKVVKTVSYAERTDDEACTIKGIHILDDNILLLSDSPEFPPMTAPTTARNQLIISRVIWSWQSSSKHVYC